jgi:hypothetical protein
MRLLLCLGLLAVPATALAQSARLPENSEIVVEGRRPMDKDGKPVPMSSWRVAETDNLLVYAGANDERLVPISHNLQKLHFLLNVLFGRTDETDDTVKLRVTLFGSEAEFDELELRNTRWQMGPYPWKIPAGRYYDPREDGAVMAVPRDDQKVTLRVGYDMRNLLIIKYAQEGNPGEDVMAGFDRNKVDARVNELNFDMSLESRVYAAYAQHYLQTYFPAAYPRWYLDGFGEIFSTLTSTEGAIEYGRAPDGLHLVLDEFGPYPVGRLVDGSYLTPSRRHSWSPYHAWAIAHLMFFNEEWRPQLQAYLAAVARGASLEEQRAALGDVDRLQTLLRTYRGRKIPYERLDFPAGLIPEPLVRQLDRSEAAYVKGRLELGARLDLPPEPDAGTDRERAARMSAERRDAIEDREEWLRDLRITAAQYPGDLELQLLLAEAECRTGDNPACIAAADRVLAQAPQRSEALAWKGTGMMQQAVAGPAASRRQRLREARATIVRANHADPDAIGPLIAYYRSFADAGEVPSDVAATGLIRATEAVPSAPATRLMLGEEYARRGDGPATRRTLRPIAIGAYDSPERARARALLDSATE